MSEIDEQVIPTLRKLVERHQALVTQLSRYQAGGLPWPDLAVLERLRAIRARQESAIKECIQQAANADATLVALLQESDEAKVATRAKTWADDLLTLYDSLAEVLRGEEDVERLTGLPVYPAPSQNGDGIGEPPSNLVRLVEDALRKLNKPSDLAACALLDQLDLTIRSADVSNGDSRTAEGTPLERAHALREALVLAIGRLKPANANGDGTAQALQYHILHEELEWPNSRIVTRHSISESTFHRLRRGAIQAIARDLMGREEIVSKQRDAGARSAASYK